MLKTFIARHGGSSYAAYAQARLEELSQIAAAGGSGTGWGPFGAGSKPGQAKPPEQPAPPKPADQQVAVVVPKTPPAPPKPAEDACEDGLLVSVVTGKKPCIKPGSGAFFKDCPDCPEMVIVPSGSFTMGSSKSEPERQSYEEPRHSVTIRHPFAVGRFAVTRDEFETFVTDSGHKMDSGCWVWTGSAWNSDSAKSWRSPGFAQTGEHPVVCVNWDDAKAYAAWLSKKTGKEYRLLSEAEREYAARAGTDTPFWWGSSISTDKANYDGNYTYGGSKGKYRQQTLPVKSFDPNPWGLYQVHGNVWDWVEDCWHDSYHNTPSDGSAWTTGACTFRGLRGGSWYNNSQYLRAAFRLYNDPRIQINNGGFRVALGWQDLNR